MTTTPGARALTALATGAATTVYYAVPDLVRSRAARGGLKTACMVLAVAAPASLERETWRDLRSRWQDGDPDGGAGSGLTDEDGKPVTAAEWWRTASPRAKGTAAAVGVGLVVASTALTVVGEQWLFRRGEARAAAGVRYAHTRQGLVLGVLSGALQLIPDAAERR